VLGFGGNTACLEIELPSGKSVVIDAGSGIRDLGARLCSRADPQRSLHLFLTHFHWDHIQGIPFYEPLYRPGNEVTFHSMASPDEARTILERQMAYPYFPFDYKALCAKREYIQTCDEPFYLDELTVRSFPMNHPQGAVGYRFECEGAVVVHASDFEHGD